MSITVHIPVRVNPPPAEGRGHDEKDRRDHAVNGASHRSDHTGAVERLREAISGLREALEGRALHAYLLVVLRIGSYYQIVKRVRRPDP